MKDFPKKTWNKCNVHKKRLNDTDEKIIGPAINQREKAAKKTSATGNYLSFDEQIVNNMSEQIGILLAEYSVKQ